MLVLCAGAAAEHKSESYCGGRYIEFHDSVSDDQANYMPAPGEELSLGRREIKVKFRLIGLHKKTAFRINIARYFRKKCIFATFLEIRFKKEDVRN